MVMRMEITGIPTLIMQLQPVFRCSSLSTLDPGVGGKSRRYAMVPAFGMVILSQNLSTGNGQTPGYSCILSVDYEHAFL